MDMVRCHLLPTPSKTKITQPHRKTPTNTLINLTHIRGIAKNSQIKYKYSEMELWHGGSHGQVTIRILGSDPFLSPVGR
jgi:hypothetical protein